MKFFLFYSRREVNNKGISLLELIIAVSIIAILVGAIVPQYIKFVNKSRKATDLTNADTIARAFERVIINNPEFYELYAPKKPNGALEVNVDEQVAGERGYKVYALLSSENFGMFSGTTYQNSPKNSEGKNIYEALNDELGIQQVDTATAQSWQRSGNGRFKNDIMVPQYKITKQTPHPYAREGKVHTEVDRWRICKNAKTGQLEIWAADGSKAGGWPCFRLWPVPCDAYAE